jgi:RNA polymerase sigma factor (sigma-70 family)
VLLVDDDIVALGQRLISHRRQALHTARSLVGGQDAEDVLQEAIARVLGAAARGAVIEDPGAYLRTTVRHVASDHIAARQAESVTGMFPERGSGHADPQAALELRELFAAIDELPERQRVALLTTALTARDQHHLAELLNTTSAGVRQLVRRARQRLHDTLGAWIPWLATRPKDVICRGRYRWRCPWCGDDRRSHGGRSRLPRHHARRILRRPGAVAGDDDGRTAA